MARKKYNGVYVDKSTGKYRAFHSNRSLGYYLTAEEAARAKDLGMLAVVAGTRRKAGKLNFSREDYTDAEIEAMKQRINAPKKTPASQYNNVDARVSGKFEARVRCGGARPYLGSYNTAKKAAEVVDLAKMLLCGGSPAAVAGLNLDWSAVSEDELRSMQGPVLQTLLDRLQETPGQRAADCRKALLHKNAGLQQAPVQPQQPPVQQRRQRTRSATQQEQRQRQAQQQAQQQQAQQQQAQQQQQQQQQAARPQQAQGQERQAPQQETAPPLQVVLALPAEAVQQAVDGMQSMASGLQQVGSGMQHLASGLQQLACSVQQMSSGRKRTAGAPPIDAAAPKRRSQL